MHCWRGHRSSAGHQFGAHNRCRLPIHFPSGPRILRVDKIRSSRASPMGIVPLLGGTIRFMSPTNIAEGIGSKGIGQGWGFISGHGQMDRNGRRFLETGRTETWTRRWWCTRKTIETLGGLASMNLLRSFLGCYFAHHLPMGFFMKWLLGCWEFYVHLRTWNSCHEKMKIAFYAIFAYPEQGSWVII